MRDHRKRDEADQEAQSDVPLHLCAAQDAPKAPERGHGHCDKHRDVPLYAASSLGAAITEQALRIHHEEEGDVGDRQ